MAALYKELSIVVLKEHIYEIDCLTTTKRVKIVQQKNRRQSKPYTYPHRAVSSAENIAAFSVRAPEIFDFYGSLCCTRMLHKDLQLHPYNIHDIIYKYDNKPSYHICGK